VTAHITSRESGDKISFADAHEAIRLVVWRDSLVSALWRPGRHNAPTLRAELQRVERQLVQIFWPGAA